MAHPNSKKARAAKQKRARERNRASAKPADESGNLKRQGQQSKRDAEHSRSVRLRKIRNTAAVAGLGALAVTGLFFVIRPDPELDGVTKPTNSGRGHVSNASYATATPTSGTHDAGSPACGVRTTELEAPLAVHALEHGAVLIWYKADQPDLGDRLAEMVSKWDSHVIVAPNAQLESPIVATAWNRLNAYDAPDAEINEFIDIYRFRGPENVSCDM